MQTHRTPTHEAVITDSRKPESSPGRLTRRQILALLGAFGVPSTALAQDPVKSMPKSYRVAFENEFVRVLEYRNRPGMGPCGTGIHYHPKHIDIFMTSFRARGIEDGKSFSGNPKAGDVHWYDAGTHEIENIDKTASTMFMIEIKDASWKPSTG